MKLLEKITELALVENKRPQSVGFIELQKAFKVDKKELAKLIKNKEVLFYNGINDTFLYLPDSKIV